ncbi:MAG: hypothetical protein OSB82_00815 [Alphaproteobacteria bacterium]|nr:hypothetical protein [Alphaproteobacteria bacterium]
MAAHFIDRSMRRTYPDLNRTIDIFQLLKAGVFEAGLQGTVKAAVDGIGYRNRARRGESLKPGSHVHANAVRILFVNGNIPDINTHAQLDDIMARKLLLHFDGAVHRARHRRELGQPAVTLTFYYPALITRHGGIKQIRAKGQKGYKRALLVIAHQARIINDIGCHNRGETALHRNPPWRRA